MSYLIYAGPRERINGISHLYYRLEDLKDNDGKQLTNTFETFPSDSKIWIHNYIGGIYPVTYKEEGRISYFKKDVAVAQWQNTEDIIKWKAFETALLQIKELDKRLKENLLIKSLQPLKEVYRQSGTIPRRQLLAEIIRIITT